MGVLVLIVLILIVYKYYRGLGTLGPMSESEKPVVIACFGIDKKYDLTGEILEDAVTADTIVVAFLDEPSRNTTFLVIPGDTVVDDDEWEGRMIGDVYALGGVDGLVDLLERIMDVSVSRHVTIDYQGFVELVDLIDGIDVVIDSSVVFVDRMGGYEISLDTGTQHLQGEQALAYVRYVEEASGEIGRLERQKQIVSQMVKHTISKIDLSKVQNVYNIFAGNVLTNLSLDDALRLASFGVNVAEENVSVMLVPRLSREDYWVIDKEGLEEMLVEIRGLRN